MAVAEVATGLFATIDSNAIIGCGTAIQEVAKLYGALGGAIDQVHQSLFSEETWSGPAANSAQNSFSNMSASNAKLQGALSTIGQTLVEYGMALAPFQKKLYLTPVEGSRDPEAAADLAIVGAASALAAVKIASVVPQMAPIANSKKKKGASDSAGAASTDNSSTLAGISGAALTPAALPGANALPLPQAAPNGSLPLGLLPGIGPITPKGVGPGGGMAGATGAPGDSEEETRRKRTISADDDSSFWTEGQASTGPGVIGEAPRARRRAG